MPERLAYDEAMLFSSTRLKMPDPELKQGKVALLTAHTSLGPVERPWGIEGGFAVVYKFRTRSGQWRALRCFRTLLNQDMQFRYERLGAYFRSHAPAISAITIDFTYYDTGILVKEQGQASKRTYPVIDMEWVDSLTLLEKVDELCQQRNSAGLRQLKQQWLILLATLRRYSIAHGDLAGVNVMMRPDGHLVLIDYDGVYIPEFAGMNKVLLGQADYRHPQMSLRQFDEYMDDFSALVIYCALFALEVRPQLWEKYMQRDVHGRLLDTSLLFSQRDYKDPQQSALFQELEQLDDVGLKAAIRDLKQACLLPVSNMRFPSHLLAPLLEEKMTLVSTKSDAVAEHVRVQRLVSSAGAKTPGERRAGSSSQGTHVRDRQLEEQALAFDNACQADDDLEIAAAYEAIDNFSSLGSVLFTAQQQQRARLAQQRRAALARLRMALVHKRPQQIVGAYDHILDACKNVTQRERTLLALARAFVRAYEQGDDEALIIAAAAIQDSPYHSALLLTEEEQRRIEQARNDALKNVPLALPQEKDERQRTQDHIEQQEEQGQGSVHRIVSPADVEAALTRKEYGEALRMARGVQAMLDTQTLTNVLSFKLQKATLRFIRQQDLTDLTVRIEARGDGNYALVHWCWPVDDLIDSAVIVWSPDGWPPRLYYPYAFKHASLASRATRPGERKELESHAQLDSSGRYLQVERKDQQGEGYCELALGRYRHIFVQGYAAMRDRWSQEELWRFADGLVPTSQIEAFL